MERLIIDVLTECATVTGTRRIMRLTWDEAWGVMERAVRRGRERKKSLPARYIGVDEKAFRKGHDYVTVVCDLINSTVEHVADERKAGSLEEYYLQFTREQLERIKAVAMTCGSLISRPRSSICRARRRRSSTTGSTS